MKPISVSSRAHRALGRTARFHFERREPGKMKPYRGALGAIGDCGEEIGVYENPEGEQPQAVVLSENGLLVIRPDTSQWIKFSEIQSICSPGADQGNSNIAVQLRSGIIFNLRIAGTDGKFRDVFSFVRFLDRVLEDKP